MGLFSHIQQLQEKHVRLKAAIAGELQRPMPDFGLVTAYKKQKLLIKEELQRLQGATEEEAAAAAA